MGSFPEKYNDPFALGYKGEPYNDKCNHPRGLIVSFRLRPSLQGGRVTLVLGFTLASKLPRALAYFFFFHTTCLQGR